MIHFHRLPKVYALECVLLLININVISGLSNVPKISRIGVLTSGGDCPGLNACIRAIAKSANNRGIEVFGLPRGLPGLLQESPQVFELDESYLSSDMLKKGGSRLGGFVASDFSTFDGMSMAEKADGIASSLETLGIDGIIATGGDSSLERIGTLLSQTGDDVHIPFVGIPKSIDNDIPQSIYSLGFQTAVSTAADAIAGVRDTAESHRRIIVVECMGREAGFLTLHAGLAGGADTILLPEFQVDQNDLLDHVQNVYDKNQCAVIAVSEAISLPQTDEQSTYTTADGKTRLGGSAEAVARFLSESLQRDARHVVLGHVQRGGPPNAYDQVMASSLGSKAVDVLCRGMSEVFVTRNGHGIDIISLEQVRDVPAQSLQSDSPEIQCANSMGIYCGTVL